MKTGADDSRAGLSWRRYRPGRDTAAVCALYRAAIDAIPAEYYSDREKAVWSYWARSEPVADKLLRQGLTLQAFVGPTLAGFCQLYPTNAVNMLYVAPAYQKQGLGRQLIRLAVQAAREQGQRVIRARASRVSRPLFAAEGFVPVGTVWLERQGERLAAEEMVLRLP